MKQFFIGSNDFRSMAAEKISHVDKGLFIEEVLADHTLIKIFTRPARFGKTTIIKTLNHFFQSLEGPYCVLHLNFLSLVENDFNAFKEAFKYWLCELYRAFRETLLEKDVRSQAFEKVLKRQINGDEIVKSLQYLTQYLYNKYNKRIIILVDEYDSPLTRAYFNNYYSQAVEFFQTIFRFLCKDNLNLFQILLFGVLPLSINEIFSAINNFAVYSVLDEKYGKYFGFTNNEVMQLLPDIKELDEIEKCYGGYKIGNYKLFNPYFIMECYDKNKISDFDISTHIYDGLEEILKNIKNTHPQLLEKISDKLRKLLAAQVIEAEISKAIQLDSLNECSIWSLLVHLGMVCVKDSKKVNEFKHNCVLAVTNQMTFKYLKNYMEFILDTHENTAQLSC